MNKEKIIKGLKWFFHSYIWVGILVLIIDIISKNIICNNMVPQQSIELIPNFLSITYTINTHAAFGIGPENPIVSRVLYICFATIASVGIIWYFVKNQKKLPGYVKAAFMIILAGALGNMIDRIFYTAEYLHATDGLPGVVDFIDFFRGSPIYDFWHFIFNIADCGVCIGVFLIIVWIVRDEIALSKENKAKEKENPKPVDNTKVLSASEKQRLEEQERNKVE